MGCAALRLVVRGYVSVCVFVCYTKAVLSIGWCLDQAAFSLLQEAQSGRTRGSLAVLAPVTHKAAQ